MAITTCRIYLTSAAVPPNLKHQMRTQVAVVIGELTGATSTKRRPQIRTSPFRSKYNSLFSSQFSSQFSHHSPSRRRPLPTCSMTSSACQPSQHRLKAYRTVVYNRALVDSNQIRMDFSRSRCKTKVLPAWTTHSSSSWPTCSRIHSSMEPWASQV